MLFSRAIPGAAGLLLGVLASSTSAAGPAWTEKHEAGRCALRGTCYKPLFGKPLPCPDNGLAETPKDDVRKSLVDLCGDSWTDSKVCCTGDQIDALRSNLDTAKKIIGSCPACQDNFYNLFCTFTCSPDQSTFINITKVDKHGDKYVVDELDQLWDDSYSEGFYDSCKDVKFGPTNSRAMDFIGGGATNYTGLYAFLGKKSFLGSPFQINFPEPNKDVFPGMTPSKKEARSCNSTDEAYRCGCVDCAGSCPPLPESVEEKKCRVGSLPCLSFAVILIYSIFIALLVAAVSGHVWLRKHNEHKNERLRLLQDLEPSDDEDEGDTVFGAAMIDRPTKNYALNVICDRLFNRLGYACASFPGITIGFSILLVGLLSMGWLRFAVEQDPVRLWVAPDSAAAKEKEFFDANFGPFFRSEQVFLVNDTHPDGPGPVLSYDTLAWWFDVEGVIARMQSYREGVTLDKVCYNPTGDGCVVQSVSGYFHNDFAEVDRYTWADHVRECVDNPVECLPAFGAPIDPKLIFGGYDTDVLQASALVTTWVVNNYAEDSEALETAKDWEESVKNYLLRGVQAEAKERGLRLSFNTENSLEQELNKSTNTDAKIVVISYVIMFLYASLALGSTTLAAKSVLRSPANVLIQSKFMLGVVGIVIVLMSVSASIGLFSAAGIKVTLIIAEVIPFLVLAVGVDNIFLIVHEFERVNVVSPEETIPERIARSLGRMGPSILLSALTETAAFALGTAVGMPAVRNFAAYAAGAVFINAILQVTMFISVLALNQQRVEANRLDCFPCVRVRKTDPSLHGGVLYSAEEEGPLQRFIRKTYAPALLGKKAKIAIVAIFLGIFTAGLALVPTVELGLDQRVALPSDSYLIPYFNDLADYFQAGPPVYFVTRDLNATSRPMQKEICGRFTTCETYSLPNILEQSRKRPEVTYIASSSANWFDDFFSWLNPENTGCCVDANGEACFANRNPPWDRTLAGMPMGEEFVHYLNRWLSAPTTSECPLGGAASYGNALVVDNASLSVPASHFRTSHSPLRTQKDFIAAYTAARALATDIAEHTGVDVFPYSKFYIFFDQYLSIVRLSTTLIASCLGIVFLLSAVLLGSIRTALVVIVTVTMTITDIVGTMALANVSLNAVSLVNLIICVGISVEFCAHIARAFTYPSRNVMELAPRNRFRGKDARAWTALVNVGGSVFSGITVTKLLGVTVLAFTRSKIFEIYYFRVWLALVVWAASHALIFLPVMLSLVGGRGYADPESDGGLEQDLRNRRGMYPPLLEDEDYDSA